MISDHKKYVWATHVGVMFTSQHVNVHFEVTPSESTGNMFSLDITQTCLQINVAYLKMQLFAVFDFI